MARAGLLTGILIGVSLLAAVPVSLQAPGAAAQTEDVLVDLQGNAFIPKDITIIIGTNVVWTQRDSVSHTVTAEEGQPESWGTKPFLPTNTGGILNSDSYTFELLGTTKYFCEIHPQTMRGSVTVVESLESPLVTVNSNDDSLFDPMLVEINATEGVLWINSGSFNHTVTFEDESIGDLGIVSPETQIRYNFTEPGSYRYRCTYHSEADFENGMVGKVVVGGNASFPTVLSILEPRDNAMVDGPVTISGTVTQGVGQPNVTGVEVDIGGAGNWTLAEGIAQWTYEWNTTGLPNENYEITVRAMANGSAVATDNVTVAVLDLSNDVAPSGNDATPNLTLPIVALAILAAAFTRWRARA